MKNRKFIRLMLALTVFLFIMYDTAQAGGNSLSFSVSCSIPKIAGMNTPLLEKEEVRSNGAANQEQANIQQALQGQQNLMLQKDSEKNTFLTTGAILPVTVKTFYSR